MILKNRIKLSLCWVLLAFAVMAYAEGEGAAEGDAAKEATTNAVSEVPVESSAEQENYFNAYEFQVEGNTVLTALQIEKTVYPFLGEHKSVQDVEKARVALEKTYRDNGYLTVFVDIPEQDVVSGIIKLHVTEGKVNRLRVTGSHYYSLGKIKEGAPSLAEGEIPNFNKVQQELGNLNRSPGRNVTPVLKAGRTPGTVDVELKVNDKSPLNASIELTDRYSANTSHLRLTGTLRYDNLWQLQHSLSVQFQVTPEDPNQVKVFSGTYLIPFEDSSRLLALYAVHTNSNLATVGNINVLGSGNILGARLIQPLPALKDFSHSLTLGVDYKDFGQNVVLGSGQISSPVRYIPFSVQYSATIVDDLGQTNASFGPNFSFRGLMDRNINCVAGDPQDQFECSRHGAKPNFFYFRGNVERIQPIYAGFSLRGRLDGQLTREPLISNEQFGGGGVDSVRGYKEFDVAGDNGLRGSLEINTPSYAKYFGAKINDLHFLGFTDWARISLLQPLPSQQAHFLLSSLGLGVRLKGFTGLTGELDFAHTFQRTNNTADGENRAHFRLFYEF